MPRRGLRGKFAAALAGTRDALPDPMTNAPTSPTEPRAATKRRPRILLAEDDPELRGLIRRSLTRDGFEVVECSDGAELLVVARHDWRTDVHPDLVVTDQRMPGFTGIEAVAGMRCMGLWIPALIITAFPEPEFGERAAALGAAVLAKPFDIDDLRVSAWKLAG